MYTCIRETDTAKKMHEKEERSKKKLAEELKENGLRNGIIHEERLYLVCVLLISLYIIR